VGSVRAFYAVINHLVVKRNLHSHEGTELFINYQLVLRIIENIAMCESQAIVETILGGMAWQGLWMGRWFWKGVGRRLKVRLSY
jgi:hypothetical protein